MLPINRKNTTFPLFRGRAKGAVAATVLMLAMAVGCVPPVQYGADQCPDVNVNATAVKDNPFVGMPAAVDALMAAYLAEPGAPPGCAVGIMENNTISHLKGYGLADLANNVPYSHATPADVGSVSKTWTALAVLRLMEMGLIGDLDDPLSDYVPGVPGAWAGITIRQLLSHTSGLQREPLFNPALNTEVELSTFFFPNLPPVLHLGIHPRLVYYSYLGTPVVGFEAGDSARYSNIGYMLLGAVIDFIVAANSNIVGDDFDRYESFVWRQVGLFDGMLGNGDQMVSECLNEYWRQNDIVDLAKGYTWDGNSYVHTVFANSPTLMLGPAGWEGPPGGWTITIGDMVRLMMAIQNDDIISQNTKDNEMMTVYGSDGSGNWGLGVNLIQKLGRPVFMHDGKYPGYRARYTAWPGEDFGVAIMCNESNADMRDITDDIGTVFIGAGPGGGLGAVGAGVGPASFAVQQIRETDDNDPGLGADVSDDDTPPDLTDAERRAIFTDIRREEASQLAATKKRQAREDQAERKACFALVDDLISETGFRVVEPLVQCADSAGSRGEYERCIVRQTNDLARRGVITSRQKTEIRQCANLVDFSAIDAARIGGKIP